MKPPRRLREKPRVSLDWRGAFRLFDTLDYKENHQMTLPMTIQTKSAPDRALSGLSKPTNSNLRCKTPVQVRISGEDQGTPDKFITRPCRECWHCVTAEKNNIVGKLLAEATECTRIDLWTLTYSGKGPESRLGAKVRLPQHIQKFQKAMRERERRAIRKYNRREKKAAEAEGRDPKLIDATKSYIRFYPVFEFGSKNGRGHWHCFVFYRSHFPVRIDALAGTAEAIPATAKRVWMPDEILGAATDTLPPDANNPEVVDWRVREHGSQTHAL